MPLKLKLNLTEDLDWVRDCLIKHRLSRSQYQYKIGRDGLDGPRFVETSQQTVCLYLPQVVNLGLLKEMYPLLRHCARRKAWSTKRIVNAGGQSTHRNRDGTWSRDPRPVRDEILRDAREGTFGWRGAEPCAFNLRFPQEYVRLTKFTEVIGGLFCTYWPEEYERLMLLASRRPNSIVGRSPWSQAICNWLWWMSAHDDDGNIPGSWSAEIVLGRFSGGRLIFPRLSLAVSLEPGDLLLFDGREIHGVEKFQGERLSTVWYLRPAKGVR